MYSPEKLTAGTLRWMVGRPFRASFGVWAYFQGQTAVCVREGNHFMVHVRLFVASCSCILYWWWNLLPFLVSKTTDMDKFLLLDACS